MAEKKVEVPKTVVIWSEKRALENCYTFARRKARRAHSDPDWQWIISFCEAAGLSGSVLRGSLSREEDSKPEIKKKQRTR